MISKTELTISCIDIYIRGVLYEQLKEDDMLGQFALINPASVSVAGGGPMLGGVKEERGRVIARCLQRAMTSKLLCLTTLDT
ncbi:hypothetical protein Q3G72_003354 [Acer saccharum]|nr:hypothetical protein Q3G72_003354 [Acer saccharum]